MPMSGKDSQHQDAQNRGLRVPQGFTVHSSGLASEYAREQGWGINEEERTRMPAQKQNYAGGMDYEYGARDFGDAPVNVAPSRPAAERTADRNNARPMRQKRRAA